MRAIMTYPRIHKVLEAMRHLSKHHSPPDKAPKKPKHKRKDTRDGK
jgi:hypothetical protein